jgi:hypothetical protein
MQTTRSLHIFLVNMTLEKPPWGKPFGSEILLWRSQAKIETRNVVYIGDISEISDISPKFSLARNFPRKMSRHFRHFECVATHSLTREFLRKCRGSMESVGLLGLAAEKVRVKGVLEAAGCLFWSLFHF